jgi:hypothetical protein
VTVANLAPELTPVSDLTIHRVRSLKLEDLPVTFTDAGSSDVHTATVDWGDGSPVATPQIVEPGEGVPGEVRARHSYSQGGEYVVTVALSDDDGGRDDVSFTVDVIDAQVVGRWVFYNNSAFDGNDPSANSQDDHAVAPQAPIADPSDPVAPGGQSKELGKRALLPGETASFANYTSYSRGLNGVMVDVEGLVGVPTEADFVFRVGNDSDLGAWPLGPAPESITMRAGGGVNGSDRITLIWADEDPFTPRRESGAVSNQWLQVTVLATATTGLSDEDVFYFGNAIGESGNSTAETNVDTNDEIGTRNHPHSLLDAAALEDAYDYDRDRRVDTNDEMLARNNSTSAFTRLELIVAPDADNGAETVPEPLQAEMSLPLFPLDAREGETNESLLTDRPSRDSSLAAAVSRILTHSGTGESDSACGLAPLRALKTTETEGTMLRDEAFRISEQSTENCATQALASQQSFAAVTAERWDSEREDVLTVLANGVSGSRQEFELLDRLIVELVDELCV